jgi:hypothetical protein
VHLLFLFLCGFQIHVLMYSNFFEANIDCIEKGEVLPSSQVNMYIRLTNGGMCIAYLN